MGDKRRVELQFTVNGEFGSRLTHSVDRLSDDFDGGVLCAALGAERQESNDRSLPGECGKGVSRGHRDISELLGVRLRHDSAVTVGEGAAIG